MKNTKILEGSDVSCLVFFSEIFSDGIVILREFQLEKQMAKDITSTNSKFIVPEIPIQHLQFGYLMLMITSR